MHTDVIVALIEEELERLRKVRAILLSLQEPEHKAAEVRPAEQVHVPVLPPTIVRLPSRKQRERRPRLPQPVAQPTALQGAIPAAPVVFRPSTPKRIELTAAPPVVVKPGSFAAMVRAAEQELQPHP